MSKNTMKLSKDALEVLKNFGSINQNLKVAAGNQIKTISEGQHIYAEATLDETFPTEFCVYEIGQLLGAIALFDKEPTIEFGSHDLKIQSEDKKNSVKFVYAAEEAIVVPPAKLNLPGVDATLSLSEKQISQAMKAAGVMKLENLSFVSDGQSVKVVVHDVKNKDANRYSIDVDSNVTEEFNLDTRVEYLTLLGGDYDISICIKGKIKCAIFQHKTFPVKYVIAGETTSKFGG